MKPGSKRLMGAVVVASACGAAHGPGAGPRGGEWTTSHGDAQRTSWVRTDARLTKDAVQKGELKFLWKMKLDNETRQLNSLTTPVLMDRLISHRGFKALAFVGASGERVYAIDTDLARVYWTTVINYSSITPPANSSWACPGGLMAAATRPTTFAVSAFGGGRGGGRGGGSGSSVGEPGKGAPSLALVVAGGRAGRGAERSGCWPWGGPAGSARSRRAQVRPGRPRRRVAAGSVAGRPTTSSSSRATATRARSIRTTAPTACRPCRSCRRMPGHPALIAVDGVLYTSTSNGCGAAPNGVWAHRPRPATTKKPVSWKTNGGNVAGTAGPTFGTDGTIFVAVGASLRARLLHRARRRTRTRSWPSSRRR